jgi:hypothetical protein
VGKHSIEILDASDLNRHRLIRKRQSSGDRIDAAFSCQPLSRDEEAEAQPIPAVGLRSVGLVEQGG